MIKNQVFLVALFGVFVSGGMVLPVFAQTGANTNFEEIIVTGRKREESLQEVPVAISVATDTLIKEAGIFDAQDLFDASVGFVYDTGWGDRNTAQPGVRGVQGNGIGVTQQKINSFLDGFPLVGQQGSLGFVDVQRVELYRGPQSAAFGRATFAGAINYVSRNPTEEFEARVSLGTSNYQRNEMKLALAGPITDTLGFTLDLSSEKFQGPNEWRSTDGYRLSATSTDYASAKVVWEITDAITAKLRYINQKADDIPGNRTFIDNAEFVACTNYTLPSGRPYYQGDVTSGCDLSIPATGITRNHDVPGSAGLVPGDPNYLLALSTSVLDPYARDERERFQLELDFAVGDGLIQVLAMTGEEYTEVWHDADNTAGLPTFSGINPLIPGAGTMVGASIGNMANPYFIDERYVEVRWVSPSEERLRYMVGGTQYKADVPGLGTWGKAGELLGLDGDLIQGRPFGPRSIFGDGITNLGVFASGSYDISDRTTVTAEGRYQQDKISNVNVVEGNKVLENETSSFMPRLSITHNLENGLTLYGQLAQGTNPAGVNIGYTFDRVAESIAIANAAGFVSYGPDTFKTYVEEKLTNAEIGIKGIAFDNKLNFAAALYKLKWENQTNIYTVNWDDPSWNDGSMSGGVIYTATDVAQRTTLNEGTISNMGIEFEGTYHLTNNWSLNGNMTLMDVKYDEFCDVLAAGGNFAMPADGTAPATGVGCAIQDGNMPPNISKVAYALGVAYRAPIGDSDWRLSARMDLRHTGSQWMDTSNIMKVGARDLINSSISATNDIWTVRLWVNNLTDDRTPQRVGLGTDYNISANTRNLIINPQKPREVGLGVTYAF